MKYIKKHRFLFLFAIIGLICALMLLSLYKQKSATLNKRLTVDANAVNIGENMTHGETPAPGTISIPGFERMTISEGRTNISCNIFNPEKNNCYFVAVIALEDGRELYRSGLIPPGKAIYSATLSGSLAAGLYDATLTYYCYELNETQTELNGATTHFILEVIP